MITLLKTFFQSRINSFIHGFAGCKHIICTQQNAWIHSFITIIAIILGVYLKLDRTHWCILVLTIGLVWIAEAFNTSLETLIDLVSPQFHPLAKISKDVGAAAVLMAAVISLIIGYFILLQPILNLK